jgi:long-subunit fatty acid transport protein
LPDSGLSFAVSGSAVFSDIQHLQARNISGHDDTFSEGRALLDVSGVQFAMSAGVYWEALPKGRLRVGLSYALRPGLGEMRLSGTLRQFYNETSVKDVDMIQTFPDVLRFGFASRPVKSLEIRFDSELVPWSIFQRQCIVAKGGACQLTPDGADTASPPQVILAIRRQWKDASASRLGVGYFPDEKSELYTSVGYDTSAVSPQTLEATYPDAFKMMFSLGYRLRFSDAVAVGASYTLVHYFPVTANHQTQASLRGESVVPNEDGTYKSDINFFNLNSTFSF